MIISDHRCSCSDFLTSLKRRFTFTSYSIIILDIIINIITYFRETLPAKCDVLLLFLESPTNAAIL